MDFTINRFSFADNVESRRRLQEKYIFNMVNVLPYCL